MIVDSLHNYKLYPFGSAWQLAFDFLLALPADAEEKKYPLLGDEAQKRGRAKLTSWFNRAKTQYLDELWP